MCCLFGLIDYKNTMTIRDKEKLIKTLSIECEERGTDATGVSYIENGKMKVFKKPLPAHKIKFHFKTNPKVIMGHTRMTTQGSEKFNYNNHPFLSERLGFSLAHNGVLHNDKYLRRTEKLPETNIETDSYIAVQLIEQKKILDFKSVAYMTEKVRGSFCFTILSKNNELYIVKGDNPMSIAKTGDIFIYASTSEILKKALKRLKISDYDLYALNEGDIVRFEGYNKLSTGKFEFQEYYSLWEYGYDRYSLWDKNKKSSKSKNKIKTDKKSTYLTDDKSTVSDDYELYYLECLYSYARILGYDESVIDDMLEEGFDFMDIENFLYKADMDEMYGDDYCTDI